MIPRAQSWRRFHLQRRSVWCKSPVSSLEGWDESTDEVAIMMDDGRLHSFGPENLAIPVNKCLTSCLPWRPTLPLSISVLRSIVTDLQVVMQNMPCQCDCIRLVKRLASLRPIYRLHWE